MNRYMLPALVKIEKSPSIIKVTRSKYPYRRDLIRAPMIMLYAVILCVGFYFLSYFASDKDPWWFLTFQIALFLSPYIWPTLIRLVDGLMPAKFEFDITNKLICFNSRPWCAFDRVAAVDVHTKPGMLMYRRFRLVVKAKDGRELRIVDTPLWADWSCPGRYRAEIRKDRLEFPCGDVLQTTGLLWRPFIKGMRGFDPEDPLVREIFDLREQITKIIASDNPPNEVSP